MLSVEEYSFDIGWMRLERLGTFEAKGAELSCSAEVSSCDMVASVDDSQTAGFESPLVEGWGFFKTAGTRCETHLRSGVVEMIVQIWNRRGVKFDESLGHVALSGVSVHFDFDFRVSFL